MTLEELKALAKSYYGVDGYVWHEDVVMRLFEETERLKSLIKDVESCVYMSHGYAPTLCPWCMCEDSHALDCPAFNPNGSVK
jgi:hypothetical protein